MSPKTLANAVTRNVSRQMLTVQKHSPTLLFGAGVVGVLGSIALACRATLKIEGVLEKGEEELATVKDAEEKSEKFAEEEGKKARAFVQLQTAIKVARLYAPSALVLAGSIACLTGSHVVLNKRHTGALAAYAALSKGFDEYRGRVVNEFGEEKDRDLRYGVVDREIVEQDEHGDKVTIVKGTDPKKSPMVYGKVFAAHTSRCWSPDPGANQTFLMVQQQYANDKLQTKGHIFLNEVYDSLGLERTPEGAVVGWLRGHGANHVSFGFFDNLRAGTDFVNGDRNSLWLDFNVTGPIWDKI